MTISVEAITPRRKSFFDPKETLRAIRSAMKDVADDVQKDFRSTTRAWKEKPSFKKKFIKLPNEYVMYIRPEGRFADRYLWVDFGTRPRLIEPNAPNTHLKFRPVYKPSTRPRVLSSVKNSRSGNFVYPKVVRRYKGIRAREFSETIARKVARPFQIAIDSAIRNAEN